MDVVEYVNLASVGSAALCLLVGMLFIHLPSGWFRLIIVAVAVFAIAAPIFQLRNTLGMPSPWLEDGRYRLFGWQVNEEAGFIYVMVTHPTFDSPREYQLPFDLDVALRLQEIRQEREVEEMICLQYDSTRKDGKPVELRTIQAPDLENMYTSCDLRWKED